MRGIGVIFAGGLMFGFGLGLCDLIRQEVVLSFLTLDDLGLGLTMAAAIAATMPIYKLVAPRLPRPVLGGRFETFPCDITSRHVVGGVLFGVGWGVSGVCPGAAIASLGAGNWPILAGLAGMLVGAYLEGCAAAAPPQASGATG